MLGRAKLQRGDLDGAAAALERALVVREAALGTKHPDLALPLIARARLLLARRDAAAALGDTDRALALIADASFDASDRGELAMVHGWALEQVGRTVEAAAWRTVAGAMLLAAGPAGGRLGAELARGGG